MKKRFLIALTTILGMFIITNPTTDDAKNFIGEHKKRVVRMEKNFVFCSIYSSGSRYSEWDDKNGKRYYFGVFLNFFEIKHTPGK